MIDTGYAALCWPKMYCEGYSMVFTDTVFGPVVTLQSAGGHYLYSWQPRRVTDMQHGVDRHCFLDLQHGVDRHCFLRLLEETME